MFIPSSRIEDERVGPVADQFKEQARQTGQVALEHGKQIAQETASVAAQKAQENGQAHAQEISDSAKQLVAQVQQTATGQG